MQNLTATSIHHRFAAAPTSIKAPRASLRAAAANSILTAAVRYVLPPPPPSASSGGTQGPAADDGFNFLSRADDHHLFDGGAAETYACRLTGRIHGHSGIARLLDPSRGHGAVVVHAGRLVFFDDRLVAMPGDDHLRRHQVRVMPDFFDVQLGCAAMVAHPNKLDPASGDLIALYHDFAIAESHHQVVVVFNLPEMFRGGSPVVLDDRAKNTSRFAVLLPKYAAEEVVWVVDVPDNFFFFFFHLWMTPADDYSTFNFSDHHLCMANSRYHSTTL